MPMPGIGKPPPHPPHPPPNPPMQASKGKLSRNKQMSRRILNRTLKIETNVLRIIMFKRSSRRAVCDMVPPSSFCRVNLAFNTRFQQN
ncbi:hypothetical protein ANCDUO_06257 [Ancylostoma duodenale]|uniref:Uncharacterized protein n=1 Tax=Ancylostoma duodenale TaxID=51022 RepID=A0A0C2GQ20_9BILA|nr:hypothetical protein ANCDUO_06257 [Ancylostoma duodenale]